MRKDEFPIIDKHVQNEIVKVLNAIKEDIETYYLDCDFSVYDKDENCKKCNDNVFNSIRNIIDRKIKETES